MHRVFVYGTLRRGEGNHRLIKEARFVGETCTPAEYALIDLGSFPALVTGGTTAVVGEVYEVDPVTLARLDRLESHPRFYRRRPIRLDDGRAAEAYLLPRERAWSWKEIACGDWKSARKRGGR